MGIVSCLKYEKYVTKLRRIENKNNENKTGLVKAWMQSGLKRGVLTSTYAHGCRTLMFQLGDILFLGVRFGVDSRKVLAGELSIIFNHLVHPK